MIFYVYTYAHYIFIYLPIIFLPHLTQGMFKSKTHVLFLYSAKTASITMKQIKEMISIPMFFLLKYSELDFSER